MHSTAIIILIVFVTRGHGNVLAMRHSADAEGIIDNLVAKLSDRMVTAMLFDRADLENTTMGKPAPGLRSAPASRLPALHLASFQPQFQKYPYQQATSHSWDNALRNPLRKISRKRQQLAAMSALTKKSPEGKFLAIPTSDWPAFRNLTEHASLEVRRVLEGLDGKASFAEVSGHPGEKVYLMEKGAVFDKVSVQLANISATMPSGIQRMTTSASTKDGSFQADCYSLSVAVRPCNPFVPSMQCSYRCYITKYDRWIDGGSDLTSSHMDKDNSILFQDALKRACEYGGGVPYDLASDKYFNVAPRGEIRGVGGIIFDHLHGSPDTLDFVSGCLHETITAYKTIVRRYGVDTRRRRSSSVFDAVAAWHSI